MSSRYTSSIFRSARSISSTAAAARPSQLLNKGTTSAAVNGGRKRYGGDSEAADANRAMSIASADAPHRPVSRARPLPLMQGFHHSAPRPASHVDVAVLPNLAAFYGPTADPYSHLRMPLLPDNASPTGVRIVEALDEPLFKPEVVLVAAGNTAAVSVLTEVEGIRPDGAELTFANTLGRVVEKQAEAGGMLRDLWKGMMDDLVGATRGKSTAA